MGYHTPIEEIEENKRSINTEKESRLQICCCFNNEDKNVYSIETFDSKNKLYTFYFGSSSRFDLLILSNWL